MEVNGEEERREGHEGKEVYYYSPCCAFQKAVEAILKCLGLDESSSTSTSSSSSASSLEQDQVEERGFMAMVTRLVRRRTRQPYSSGQPGQTN